MMPQIVNTWKCNFQCAHCLFSCGPRRKGFVDRTQIIDFVRSVTDYGNEMINLVGGEPFLHPDIIWQIRFLLDNFETVRIATNGSWVFTDLYEEFQNEFYGDTKLLIMVSDDPWHEVFWDRSDYIKKVKQAIQFAEINLEEDHRRMNYHVIPMGRAVKTQTSCYRNDSRPECCDDGSPVFTPTLLPNGDIAGCCNGKGVCGNVRNDLRELEERFGKIISEKRRKGKLNSIESCTKCKTKFKIL